ncbi:MAG: FG-GAP-like repeat-containing protein [Microthrixaceae bacterium]
MTERHLGRYPVLLPKFADPRMHLAVVTTTLQVLGQVAFDFNVSIAQILITMAVCGAIEFTITFTRDKTIAWPASAMLTGNGIALILRVPGTQHGDWWSLHGWYIFVGTAVLAMSSKYLIRRRGKHIFNPSNFALVVVFVALGESRVDPQVLWWGPLSIPIVIAFAVIIGGSVVITRRVKQGYSALSFWIVFAICTGVIAASGHSITANWHVGPLAGFDYWKLLVTSPEVLVFLFFMITDPKTAPRGRVGQTLYGSGIAVVSALIVSTQSGEFGTKVGILGGLVVLCLLVRVIEARVPEPRTPEDSLPQWLTERARARPLLGPLGVIVAVAVMGALLGSAGRATASDSTYGTETAAINRRAEMRLSADLIPAAKVDPSPQSAGVDLTKKLAADVATDVALGLQIEATAIAQSDVELATAAVTGVRLVQATSTIKAGRGGESSTLPAAPPTEYRFKALTLTLIKPDGGPQTPPELAVKVEGETVDASGEAKPLNSTFTVRQVDGVYLISNEYDAGGKPVGDQRTSTDSSIEAALDTQFPTATPEQSAGLRFREVSSEVGLTQPHGRGAMAEEPLAFTGGAAVGDFDDDGYPDIFLTRVGLPNLLYRNDGGHFNDVTAGSGIEGLPTDSGSTGATWVDIDADGHLDLIVLGLGSTPNRLYLGDGAGHFRDATESWGLPSAANPDPDATGFSIAATDYDHDGHVDLAIVGIDPYETLTGLAKANIAGAEICSNAAEKVRRDIASAASKPDATEAGLTRLLRNTGSSFEDRTTSIGIDPTSLLASAVRFVDVDGDGWDDLVIGGQLCTSRVLLNDTKGGFTDATGGSGLESIETANGLEILDANGDGRFDLFTTGVSYPTASGKCPLREPRWGCGGNHLMLNNGDGSFADATGDFGVNDAKWAWGSIATDLNNDGLDDLLVATGLSNVATLAPPGEVKDLEFFERSRDTTARLWLGIGGADTPLPEVAGQVGLDRTSNSKAAVAADFDRDGLTDLLIIDTVGHPALYRNETANSNHWISIELNDDGSANRRAIGATLTLDLGEGVPVSKRVGADRSFQSGGPTTTHVGLGHREAIKQLTIRWPDGVTQTLRDVPADQHLEVTYER